MQEALAEHQIKTAERPRISDIESLENCTAGECKEHSDEVQARIVRKIAQPIRPGIDAGGEKGWTM